MSVNPSESLTRAAGAEEEAGEAPSELGALLRGESLRAQAAAAAVVLATIVTVDEEGTVGVQLAGTSRSRPARLGVPLSAGQLLAAAKAGRAAILAFENGDPALPIVVGLMQPAARREAGASPDAAESAAQEVQAEVDGRRVRITAQDEIVLECGSASITLRRNGRVVIHGDYVETCSEGTNRIKGGQVRIN
jgi:predicted pyridoxine 5'-phosphate oxidase superfamily flavin-nucleotide-binding protein